MLISRQSRYFKNNVFPNRHKSSLVIKFINKTFRIFVQSGRTDDDDRVVVVIALFSKGLSSSCYIKLLEGNEINEKETGNNVVESNNHV